MYDNFIQENFYYQDNTEDMKTRILQDLNDAGLGNELQTGNYSLLVPSNYQDSYLNQILATPSLNERDYQNFLSMLMIESVAVANQQDNEWEYEIFQTRFGNYIRKVETTDSDGNNVAIINGIVFDIN